MVRFQRLVTAGAVAVGRRTTVHRPSTAKTHKIYPTKKVTPPRELTQYGDRHGRSTKVAHLFGSTIAIAIAIIITTTTTTTSFFTVPTSLEEKRSSYKAAQNELS